MCVGAGASLSSLDFEVAGGEPDCSATAVALLGRPFTKTIADFERGARSPYPRTLEAVQSALEKAGIEFIAENGGGAGVRLRKAKR